MASTSIASHLLSAVLSALTRILAFITIRIPSFVLSLLSYTGVITLELTFTKLFILTIATFTAISYYVKLAYLNKYVFSSICCVDYHLAMYFSDTPSSAIFRSITIKVSIYIQT
jgi:hypothetical protein